MTTDPDEDEQNRIATAAYSSAVQMLNGLWAGACPDTQAEVLLKILPYFEGCAMAVLDAKAKWKPVPRPSLN